MATLLEIKTSDWTDHVSPLAHTYNAAEHDSTGFSTYYFMFSRQPRLANTFLGLPSNNTVPRSKPDYSDKLKDKLNFAYDNASKETKDASAKYKKYYSRKIRYAVLQPGDCVLIQHEGRQGPQKFADKWQ